MQRITDKDLAAQIASNILQVFNVPITIEQREFKIGASIGISMFGIDATTEESVMNHADTAMYVTKDEGRNNVRLYSAERHEHNHERANLVIELRHALVRGELRPNNQAKVDIEPGHVMGVDALPGWQSTLLPDSLIGLTNLLTSNSDSARIIF